MKLKIWLRQNNLSVRAFATAMGESYSTASKWVHGQRQPSLPKAVAIERFTSGCVTSGDLIVTKDASDVERPDPMSFSGRKRLSDDEFRDLIRQAKESHDIVDVIGRMTKLKRVGREYVGLCFAHEEKTPSLNVNQTLQVFLCRGCGATGDIISAWRAAEGGSVLDAVRGLLGGSLPKIDPAKRVRAIERDEVERSQRIADAVQVWKETISLQGTPGEAYLRSRGITSWPSKVKFARTWWWCNNETGETSPDLPAVIGLVENQDGPCGIQRIFLRSDGSGKAAIAGGKAKLSLGRVRGGALRLGPPALTIYLVEGPEDGLSLLQEMPGISVWVSLGTANMSQIRFPAETRKIVICAQNDAAADRATAEAAEKLADQGYMVDVRRPRPEFKDWNDQLCGKARPGSTGA